RQIRLEEKAVFLFALVQRILRLLALGDVTNVALNDPRPTTQSIDVADKLHGNGLAVFGFKRERFIADILSFLQLYKSQLAFLDVFERPNLPESCPNKLVIPEAQQIKQEWVNVCYLSCLRIENQDSIFGGFEEPAIFKFRSS